MRTNTIELKMSVSDGNGPSTTATVSRDAGLRVIGIEPELDALYWDRMSEARRILKKADPETAYDFDKQAAACREVALFDLLPDVVHHLQAKYDVQFIKEQFIRLNTVCVVYSYDRADVEHDLIVHAALWILETLQLNDRLENAKEFFPDSECYANEDVPDYIYEDVDTVKALCYMLRRRNDTMTKSYADRTLVNDASLKSGRNSAEEQICRDDFEALLRLIDPRLIKHAISAYKKLVYQWLSIYFDAIAPVNMAIKEKQKRILSIKKDSVTADKQVGELIDQIVAEKELLRQIEFVTMGGFYMDDYSHLVDELSCKARKVKKQFDSVFIGDDQEISFAFLYLIDRGNPLAWVYSVALGILNTSRSPRN